MLSRVVTVKLSVTRPPLPSSAVTVMVALPAVALAVSLRVLPLTEAVTAAVLELAAL